VVDFFIKLYTETTTIFPTSDIELEQLGCTYKIFDPTNAGLVAKWGFKEFLNLG